MLEATGIVVFISLFKTKFIDLIRPCINLKNEKQNNAAIWMMAIVFGFLITLLVDILFNFNLTDMEIWTITTESVIAGQAGHKIRKIFNSKQ